jgi:hypothetical protein
VLLDRLELPRDRPSSLASVFPFASVNQAGGFLVEALRMGANLGWSGSTSVEIQGNSSVDKGLSRALSMSETGLLSIMEKLSVVERVLVERTPGH